MTGEATPTTAGSEGGAVEATPSESAARTTVEPTSSAPEGQRPSIASLWAAAKEDEGGSDEGGETPAADATPPAGGQAEGAAGEGEGAPEDDAAKGDAEAKPDAETPDAEKPAEGEAEAGEDPTKLKADLDALLESYEDPSVLNAALEKAGVEKLQELPAVKALIGRISQSVRDQTTAAIQKAQAEAAQLAEATQSGKEAKGKLVAALDKLAADIEAGEEDLAIPTADAIADAFEEYAGSAVGEYHTKAWNVLSDQIYSLPEMGGAVPEGLKTAPPEFSPEAKQLLDAVKGADPATWLAAHLAVERDRLWSWAQAEAAANNEAGFENEKVVLQAAHAKEIKALTKQHEAALASAREEARAEALAEAASGKLPPKTPQTGKPKTTSNEATLDDEIPAGASISEIRRIIKARSDAGVEV